MELLDIINKNTSYINFECVQLIHEEILKNLYENYSSIALVGKNEYFYEFMNVQQYLTFFKKCFHKSISISQVIETMDLEKYKKVKISLLNSSIKKRLAIARELLKECEILILDDILQNIDDESKKVILKWLESLVNPSFKIITTSILLKDVFLFPGEKYYVNNKTFQRIEEEEEKKDTSEKILIKSQETTYVLQFKEIDYVESLNGKCIFFVRGNSFATNFTLEEIEEKLAYKGFYRCHRSYIINISRVSEIIRWTKNSFSVKITNYENTDIPLSKGRAQEMKEILAK